MADPLRDEVGGAFPPGAAPLAAEAATAVAAAVAEA